MRKLFIPLLLLLFAMQGFAQITIDNTDMPADGDTLRVSFTNAVPPDFAQGGANHSWDFSSLAPVSQQVQSYVSTLSTPSVYWLAFMPNIVSNLASPGNTGFVLPGFPVTDSYVFFNNIATGFYDLGYALKVQGLPLTMKYDTPDQYYDFPLTTGSVWSSSSVATLSIPTLAYIRTSRTRSSFVDGWGTLTTPFGTFDVIRVQTSLVQHDSVSIDTMGMGIPVTRNITQYSWLGKAQGIPLLRVNVEEGITTAIYRDIYRQGANPMTVSLGPDTAVLKGHDITLTPSVTGGIPPFKYFWSTFDTTSSLTLTVDSGMTVGVAIMDAANNAGFATVNISVRYPPGIEEVSGGSLQIMPNPARGTFRVLLPAGMTSGRITISGMSGRELYSEQFTGAKGEISVQAANLAAGAYIVKVDDGKKYFTGKLIIQ
jgi:hypothetical protein